MSQRLIVVQMRLGAVRVPRLRQLLRELPGVQLRAGGQHLAAAGVRRGQRDVQLPLLRMRLQDGALSGKL